jgi:hypothetical protein
MNTKIKKYAVVIVFIGASALFVIYLCQPRLSSSGKAAIHNIQMIENSLASNGFVRVGNTWEMPDKTNALKSTNETSSISK